MTDTVWQGCCNCTGYIFPISADFRKAKFAGVENFRATQFTRALDCTYNHFTKHLPEFNYAEYKQLTFLSIMSASWVADNTEDRVHRYRKFKHMAIAIANYNQAFKFFGLETRSRVYITNTPFASNCII